MFYTNQENGFSKLALLSLLLFSSLFLGCNEEKPDPPDLLYEFANLAQEEVNVNTPLVLQSSITNEETVCEGCSTETAQENDRSIKVEYRPDENSPWVDAQLVDQNGDIVFELVRPVPEIKPGRKYERTEGFIFSNPGVYRYKLLADRSDFVDERIETNNGATTSDGDVKSAAAFAQLRFSLTVKVVDPKGDSQPVYGGMPTPVQYLD